MWSWKCPVPSPNQSNRAVSVTSVLPLLGALRVKPFPSFDLHIPFASLIINNSGRSVFVGYLRPASSTNWKTEELHGKAKEYCCAKREAGHSSSGNGRSRHHLHGWRRIGSQGKSRSRRLAHADGYYPPRQTYRRPLAKNQGLRSPRAS